MYWVLDALCFFGGFLQFSLMIVYGPVYLCFIGIVWLFLYPFALEGLANLLATFQETVNYSVSPRSNFVYSDNYNISFCGLEKIHPFDSHKYGNIYNFLIEESIIS